MHTYEDSAISIKAIVGECFAITLKAIPITGYSWKAAYDSSIVQCSKPKQFVLQTSGIGGGGREIFEFEMRRKGITNIIFHYQREWEAIPKETKVFHVDIN